MMMFCRFYITLAKNEDENNFALTEDLEKYLYQIKKEREERIVRRVIAYVFGDE